MRGDFSAKLWKYSWLFSYLFGKKKDSFGTFLKKLKNHENGYSRIKRRMEGKWWNNQEKWLINKTIEKNQLKHIYIGWNGCRSNLATTEDDRIQRKDIKALGTRKNIDCLWRGSPDKQTAIVHEQRGVWRRVRSWCRRGECTSSGGRSNPECAVFLQIHLRGRWRGDRGRGVGKGYCDSQTIRRKDMIIV